MTREEQLACLTDRPCAVCSKHTGKGCSSWKCVFEEKPEELTGYWIFHEDWKNDGECPYECSKCGTCYDYEMDYCGKCGAHMIEKKVTE